MNAADRWARALAARAISRTILDAAPASPWGFPPALFRSRAQAATSRTVLTPTTERALEALPAAGSVLDVGVGGGATSLPLASRAGRITGFDQQADLLEVFLDAATAAGVEASAVQGTWPAAHEDAPTADVVVSGHTVYNVSELGPFVEALASHATHRVVLEATDRHPLGWMHDLWRRFHGIDIPDEPTIELAIEVLASLGIEASTDERVASDDDPAAAGFSTREEAVALVRTRLCLAADRDEDLAEALGERLRERDGHWAAGPPTRSIVTLWWNTAAG